MTRYASVTSAIALLAVPQIAPAQFGAFLSDAVRGATKPAKQSTPSASAQKRCAPTGKSDRGAKILGSILSGAASRTMGRAGIGYFLPVPEVTAVLTDVFACRLEPTEQRQAADATLKATRGGAVGSTSSWSSDARQGVTGSSTVAGKERLADGTTCMSVRDVAIVNGEEMTVSKRMCRSPGAPGYVLAA